MQHRAMQPIHLEAAAALSIRTSPLTGLYPAGGALPVEVHLVDLGVVVLDLGVSVADEDGEVGQAALHREHLGEAADVLPDAVHQALHV